MVGIRQNGELNAPAGSVSRWIAYGQTLAQSSLYNRLDYRSTTQHGVKQNGELNAPWICVKMDYPWANHPCSVFTITKTIGQQCVKMDHYPCSLSLRSIIQ